MFWRLATRTRFLWALLCLCAAPVLSAQDIISTSGVLMDGLEPWDTVSVADASHDEGILDRVFKMLQPHVLRLDRANAAVKEAFKSGGRRAGANAAIERQRVVCEDVLAIIGIIYRHNSEVATWKIEASRDRYVLTPEFFVSDNFRRAVNPASAASDADANDTAPGPDRPDTEVAHEAEVSHWPYLASVWAPFMVDVEFGVEQRELLANLGLSASVWRDEPDLALGAFLVLLRQVAVTTEREVEFTKDTRTLLEDMNSNYIDKYQLGSRHLDSAQSRGELDFLLGYSAMQPLLQSDRAETVILELGSYHYTVFPSSQSVLNSLENQGPIFKGLLFRIVWTNQVEGALIFYLEKARLYADLAHDLTERIVSPEDPETTEQVAGLYAPFLFALAHYTPCLSVFRPEKRPESGIRITESWSTGQGHPLPDLWGVDGILHDACTSRGVMPLDHLFLLQSDFLPDSQGVWQWTPRVAGFRGYLNARDTGKLERRRE